MIRKVRLISKFTTSKHVKQTVAMYIVPNVSRSKWNQVMKFGQLIEFKIINIFFEKSYTKCSGEIIMEKIEHISRSII